MKQYCEEMWNYYGMPDPKYGGCLVDLGDLKEGTVFFVCNGAWHGKIELVNRVKTVTLTTRHKYSIPSKSAQLEGDVLVTAKENYAFIAINDSSDLEYIKTFFDEGVDLKKYSRLEDMKKGVSLTNLCKELHLDRDDAVRWLKEHGYIHNIRTASKLGLASGISFIDGENGTYLVYNDAMKNILATHKDKIKDNLPKNTAEYHVASYNRDVLLKELCEAISSDYNTVLQWLKDKEYIENAHWVTEKGREYGIVLNSFMEYGKKKYFLRYSPSAQAHLRDEAKAGTFKAKETETERDLEEERGER